MKRWIILPSFLAAAVLALGSVAVAQNADAVVKQRSDIMRQNNDALKELNAAAKAGKVGAGEAAKAAEIQANMKKFVTLFPEGTGSDKVKTRAKPEIWAEKAKFDGIANDLVTAMAAAEKAAKAGDANAFGAALKNAEGACASCHKPYRGPRP